MEPSEVLYINKDGLLVMNIGSLGEYEVIGVHASGFTSMKIQKQ